MRAFEVIGEATKNLSNDLKLRYSDVAWRKMAGMRDKMIHSYFKMDHEIVWATAKQDIPSLILKIADVIEQEIQREESNKA